MTLYEWTQEISKEELTYRMANECWKCGFYQQTLEGDWFCTRQDLQKDCDELYESWKEYEL